MTGYKTVEVETRLTAGDQQHVPPTKLEVGARVEVVTVRGSSDLVRTDTPTVSQTINADFIQTLPRVGPQCAELPDLPARRADGRRRGR